MNSRKQITTTIASIVFLLTAIIIYSGTFNHPQSVFIENPLDHFYMIAVSVFFWLPAAYLLNAIFDKLIWTKVFILPVGNASTRWLQDFIWSLIYLTAVTVIISSAFFVELTGTIIFVLLLLLIMLTVFKTKFVSLFAADMFNRNRPFNIGDWISIKSKDGKLLVTGKVINFNRGEISIKNEENNLVFITTQVLTDSIIENYRSFDNDSRFSIKVTLDSSVKVERGKRILLAAALNSLDDEKLLKKNIPEILVKDIERNGITYQIDFLIKPWQEISPSQITDRILSKVLYHSGISGVFLASNKTVIEQVNQENKSTNLDLVEDRIEILKKVDFLNVLNGNELQLLAENLKMHCLHKGVKIIAQGEKGDSMFILVEGLLDVNIAKEAGGNVFVRRLIPGEFFGEMSLFTGEPRSASVEVFSDCLVFELTKESLNPILQQRTFLANEFGRVITERQIYNEEKIAQSGLKHQTMLESIVKKIKSFFHLK